MHFKNCTIGREENITNSAPTFPKNAVTDQTVTVGKSFTYTVTAAVDPDGDTLTYTALYEFSSPFPNTLNKLTGWLSFESNTLTFSAPESESEEIGVNIFNKLIVKEPLNYPEKQAFEG